MIIKIVIFLSQKQLSYKAWVTKDELQSNFFFLGNKKVLIFLQ